MLKMLIEIFCIKNSAFFIKHGVDNCNILDRHIMGGNVSIVPHADNEI